MSIPIVLKANSSAIGDICPACKKPLKEGDSIILLPIGPGDDEQERQKAREGKEYNAVALVVHLECSSAGY